MSIQKTQKPITITLEKERKKRLDKLVDSWSMDQKKFILQALNEYRPPAILPTKTGRQKVKDFFLGKEKEDKKDISHLANEEVFKSPNERYKITGKRDPTKALHKIFSMEVNSDDRKYLQHILKKETDDIYVPPGLIEEFKICHRRHHQNLLLEENAPKAPFYLILGSTGSGKTKTIKKAIELALFDQKLEIKQKVADDLEEILEKYPVMARLDLASVAPELNKRLKKEKRKKRLEKFSHIPVLNLIYKEETAEIMDKEDEEFGMAIDMDQINPNNVQTMWYGETGNNMVNSFGAKRSISIRILEEAHALLRVHKTVNAQVQEDTLITTFNIIMDEIENGERNCMVVAISRKADEFHEDIYRRFQEKGKIIDMSDYWKKSETLEELIKIETIQQDIDQPTAKERSELADKIMQVFHYRGLETTPAYVRKLLASIIEEKKDLKAEYLEDGILIRKAFVNVARNLYSGMFKRTYNKLKRDVDWNEYVGDVKEEFQRLVNQCLIHDLAAEKGVVLAGPPGTGKTFLARAYLSRHKDISDVTLKMEDLQDENDPIDGPVRKLTEAFDIAKMCAPSLLFVDEGEAVAMERQGNFTDRITNKLLNAIDGETELKGVFVTLTTNKPEHLAEAATRSGRLKVMPITGKLNERDVYKMLDNYLKEEVLSSDLGKPKIHAVAKQICATPADYSKFFETILNFKEEERKIIKYAARLKENNLDEFVFSNYKALLGIVESLNFSKEFVKKAKENVSFLMENKDRLIKSIKDALIKDSYPITHAHLERAREDRVNTPKIKSKITLDDYLESQLSTEPQVGFVVGAGASDTTGVLVPISSSFIYGEDYYGDKIDVTGAVNVNAEKAADLNAAVEMAKHSSKEALTLVLNYLSSLLQKKDVNRIIGMYLKDRHIHHQFLTAHYMSGGPSAGMALAINTMSIILDLPVRNDFGITGAPWSKGKTKKDVGSAVIIGGTHNKAQIVLSHLKRMYAPIQNIKDIDILTLESYWKKGKDVIGYKDFSSIIGEIYALEPTENQVKQLFEKRVEAKQLELIGADNAQEMLYGVEQLNKEIRTNAETAIRQRIECIERYVQDESKDKFASLQNIFEKYKK